MNRWRIAGLVLVAILAAWLTLRSCAPTDTPKVSEPPARDQFHAAKPISIVAVWTTPAGTTDLSWLERELRYLLIRGRMRVAPVDGGMRTYTLKVELPGDLPATATLRLLTPEGAVEREQSVDLRERELDAMWTLAEVLPAFLGAAHTTEDWTALLGTTDTETYRTFIRSADSVLGKAARGFTQPLAADSSTSVNQLEAVTRRHPKFARAWSLLSVAYLSLGGEDETSLTQLAESTAERALALDATLTDAQSALGLVSLRRGEWVAAMEHFNTALTTDVNASAALEGLACLLMDVGHAAAALPVASRAAALQPRSIGAGECLAYARLATDATLEPAGTPSPLQVAQVTALDALLAGRHEPAQQILRSAENAKGSAAWVDPLLRAAVNPRQTADALQAITRAASDQLIDPTTELICGAALRQSDFVFNRMLRLHKQGERVPLRMLWLPRTDFLRKHPRFEAVVSAEGLLPFWQDHGLPDVCTREPSVYGCNLKSQKLKKQE